MAADDRFTAWVNGKEVGAGGGPAPQPLDVTAALREGRNVVAVRAENMPAPVVKNPAGLLVAFEAGKAARFGTDATWRVGREEAPGWREPGFDDAKWAKAVVMGDPGMAPWGPVKPPESFPPLAFGVVDGPRVVYMLDPSPVVLQGLAPGKSYRVLEFDPVEGKATPGGTLEADAQGTARRDPPAHGHDWAFSLTPSEE